MSEAYLSSDVLTNSINQEVVYKTQTDSLQDIALAAHSHNTKSSKTCLNCKHSGHIAGSCFQKGGAMEEEVLAAKAKACAEHSPEWGKLSG